MINIKTTIFHYLLNIPVSQDVRHVPTNFLNITDTGKLNHWVTHDVKNSSYGSSKVSTFIEAYKLRVLVAITYHVYVHGSMLVCYLRI